VIDTADSQLPKGEEGLSRPAQALTLSVARRCTVEGSRPDGTRPIAHMCSEAKANVPGRVADTHRLWCVVLTDQSVFNWLDLRSYDIRVAGESKQSACIPQR
jgi:hypothetical protein